MSRRARRALIPLIAVLLGLLLAGPAGAATVIDVVDADRMEGGAAVQVTVASPATRSVPTARRSCR